MLVGGSVRDLLLGTGSKDFDIEVYGLEPDRLLGLLRSIAPVNTVGEQFTVYKLAFHHNPDCSGEVKRDSDDEWSLKQPGGRMGIDSTCPPAKLGDRFEIDVSIPRRESKSGLGHRGFTVTGDPGMSFEDAARRRDFTVNAILFDPLTEEWVDPWGGKTDLTNRVLRAVCPATFVEDSLRVLRAVQLAARFRMSVEPGTVALCKTIDLSDLPHERVWGEVEKLLTRAVQPSIGLQAALDLGVLEKLFPEILALVDCPQEPDWHPEGDVFTHTKLCIDEAVKLIPDLDTEKAVTVMLGVLLHDLGKPLTTGVRNGRIRSPGHDEAGVEPARNLLDRLGIHTMNGYDVRSQVLALVREHLRPVQFYNDRGRIPAGTFRRLAARVDPNLLYRVSKADGLGRGPAGSAVAQDWFIERIREIGVELGPPAPLLLGRHLIEAGIEPGPGMGKILKRVYNLQLDGKVTTLEDALAAALE